MIGEGCVSSSARVVSCGVRASSSFLLAVLPRLGSTCLAHAMQKEQAGRPATLWEGRTHARSRTYIPADISS